MQPEGHRGPLRWGSGRSSALDLSLIGCDFDLCELCYKHHLEGWERAVRRRGFSSREQALRCAAQHGAPLHGALVLGCVRVDMEVLEQAALRLV